MAGEYVYPDGREDSANSQYRRGYSGDSMAIKRIWCVINEFRASAALIALMICAPLAIADGVQFTSNAGDIGQSASFTSASGLQFVLDGFQGTTAADLWAKNTAPDEMGIGLGMGIEHEISGQNFLQIDLTHIYASMMNVPCGSTNPIVTVGMNSIQGQDSYNVYGSNNLGMLGKLLIANDTSPTFTFGNIGFCYISIDSPNGSVLVDDVATPEPSTLLLLGICLFFFFIGIYGFSSRVSAIISK